MSTFPSNISVVIYPKGIMRFTSLIFLLAAVLCGCGTSSLTASGKFLPPIHQEKLANAKTCCATYRDMPFGKLVLGEDKPAVISPDSPVFEFQDGRSFFVSFEIPPGDRRVVVLKTFPVNTFLNAAAHVLIPEVQFLDLEYQPLSTVKPRYVALNPRIIGDSWAEAEVAIPATARFLIIRDGKELGGMAWRDTDQRSGFLFIRSGPTGELKILVRGG